MTFTIEQLEALKEGTTPGPWEILRNMLVVKKFPGEPSHFTCLIDWEGEFYEESNGELAAASPALLDQLIAREAELQKLREEMALLASKVGVRAANAQTNGAFSSAVAFRETASAITKILEGNV